MAVKLDFSILSPRSFLARLAMVRIYRKKVADQYGEMGRNPAAPDQSAPATLFAFLARNCCRAADSSIKNRTSTQGYPRVAYWHVRHVGKAPGLGPHTGNQVDTVWYRETGKVVRT